MTDTADSYNPRAGHLAFNHAAPVREAARLLGVVLNDAPDSAPIDGLTLTADQFKQLSIAAYKLDHLLYHHGYDTDRITQEAGT